MSELQGAVAAAQLPKLNGVVESRVASAAQLTEMLAGLPGIETPPVAERDRHTFWKYCPRIDSKVVRGGSPALGSALKQSGIASAPRYIQKPAFQCQIFREQNTFGSSHWPFTLARPEAVDYDRGRFPGTFSGLEGILVLPWNEKYTDEHVEYIGKALIDAVKTVSESEK